MLSKNDQRPFIDLVDEILSAKQEGIVSLSLEKQLDELFYKLYDITPEEQNIIEVKKTDITIELNN